MQTCLTRQQNSRSTERIWRSPQCASTMPRFQLLTAATAGKRYPSGAGNLWRDASAALIVRKKRNCAENTGRGTSRCRTQISLFSRQLLIVRRYRLCWEGFQGLLSGENADTGSKTAPLSLPLPRVLIRGKVVSSIAIAT